MKKNKMKNENSVRNHPVFGMWKDRDDMKKVKIYTRKQRLNRHDNQQDSDKH